jgi:hypothetical protein
VPQTTAVEADRLSLMARYHGELSLQDLAEGSPVNSRRWSHARIMPTCSDKRGFPKLHISA